MCTNGKTGEHCECTGGSRAQRMTDEARRTMRKAQAANVLPRAGFAADVSEGILADLPEPIDLHRIDPEPVALGQHLMDSLGASP